MSTPSQPLRVVVIDDSAAVRRIITKAIDPDPGIEVVGTAANGREGIDLIKQLKPDVVTCDIEMPVLDGLQTVTEIRTFDRHLPVIMFSSLTQRGSKAVLDALARGATDYETKPTGVGSFEDALARLRRDLVPKIKTFGAQRRSAASGVVAGGATPPARATHPSIRRATAPTVIRAVLIGSSTGGPTALETVMSSLDPAVQTPILIVQHIPPVFSTMLAERLDKRCHLRVVEAADGMIVEDGCAYLAPGGLHMRVAPLGDRIVVKTDESPPVHSCRPAVDVLFQSAVQLYGPSALAVVLTGMGQDGLIGCKELASTGAPVIAQDEATSVVWGMPGFVAQHGLATDVLPLDEVAPAIGRFVSNRHRTPATASSS